MDDGETTLPLAKIASDLEIHPCLLYLKTAFRLGVTTATVKPYSKAV